MPFFKGKNHALPRSRAIENITKKNGVRHAIFNPVGDKYIGEWKNDKKSGKGIFLTKNGERYEGDMERNHRHGYGVLAQRIPNTEVFRLCYRGDWKNGKMHGNGVRIYPDGSFYEGEFKDGKRHGFGHQWYLDGTFFAGQYGADRRNGLGVRIQPDGNRYQGEWVDDKRQGKGLYYHLHDGQLQEGVWYKGYCIHSQMTDVLFRQCAITPAQYTIPPIGLWDPEGVCLLATGRALTGHWNPCYDDDFMTYDTFFHISQDSGLGASGKGSSMK